MDKLLSSTSPTALIPRDYQEDICWRVIPHYLSTYTGNPLVSVFMGGGKSSMIAWIIQWAMSVYSQTRVLVICPTKELIIQDYNEILAVWPEAPVGVYSAGLRSRDLMSQIIVGGIQSIFDKTDDIPFIDFLILDECHLFNRDMLSRYAKLIVGLMKFNPNLRVIGLTGTPFNMRNGMLHEGNDALFNDLVADVDVRFLIDNGYLVPPVSVSGDAQIDVSGVHTRMGEYVLSELSAVAEDPSSVDAITTEAIRRSENRASWLTFACSIKHANMLNESFRSKGIESAGVYGETDDTDRREKVEDFKKGKLRSLVSVNLFHTGFNVPRADNILLCRPTKSVNMYLQAVGRGLRLCPETNKRDALIQDYGSHVQRIGPIDNPIIRTPKKRDPDEIFKAPTKECEECGHRSPISAKWCEKCGHVFPPLERLVSTKPSTLSIISNAEPEWLPVTAVFYQRHRKEGKPDSLKVLYSAGLKAFAEWIPLFHGGLAQQRAERWWFERGGALLPKTVEEALERAPKLRCPTEIAVRRSGKWFEVTGHRFAAMTDNVVEFRRKG